MEKGCNPKYFLPIIKHFEFLGILEIQSSELPISPMDLLFESEK